MNALERLERLLESEGLIVPMGRTKPVYCRWCRDAGCVGCFSKREKAKKEAQKLIDESMIFADVHTDPKQMEELKDLFHADILIGAVSHPGGMEAVIAKAKEAMAARSETP